MMIRASALLALVLAVPVSLGGRSASARFVSPKLVLGAGSTLRAVVAPSSKVGIPIIVEASGLGGSDVANVSTNVTFGTARLTFDSVKAGSFGTFSAATGAAGAGIVTLNTTSATGTASNFTLATLWFTSSASTGSTTVVPTAPFSATSQAGSDLATLIKSRLMDVCVMAPAGKYGDATGDNTVNIVDAQQIARFSVGLSVSNLPAVQANGDVTADGLVNIVDAQQIARFSVGLSAAARTNTFFFVAPTVASVTATPATANLNVNQTVQLTATPKNGANASIAGCVALTWTSLSPAVATVDSTGLVTAVANGAAVVRASAGGQNFDVGVQVGPPVATTVTVALGSSSLNGNATTTATATVRDQFNNVIPGAPVTWSSLTPLVARVTSGGAVQALGAGSSAIRATSGSVNGSSTLTVSSAAQAFNIDLRVIGSMTPSQLTAFTNAVTKWQAVIRGDLPTAFVNNANLMSDCGVSPAGQPATEFIDDMVIYASVDSIDGPGNILAQAGPCYYRVGTAFTIVGVMKFDRADVASLEANGTFLSVVLHEMGHIMGVGTFWDPFFALNLSSSNCPSGDPVFFGVNAVWAFANIGFGSYAGPPVPIENQFGVGTRCSHWRESILDKELMTGFVEAGGVLMPLTALTIGSLLDEGHVVDFSQADPASQLISLRTQSGQPITGPKIQIIEGTMRPPIAIDASGRPVSTQRRPGSPP